MSASVLTGSVVHGWCGYVEKSNEVVFQQMVLNKLWIPDVLIDIIKDYLYINAAEVLRKYYRFHLNMSIDSMSYISETWIDMYGRPRYAHWTAGHIYGDGDIQMQGMVCMTCGDSSDHHQNVNGCCRLAWDEDGEILETMLMREEVDEEISDETIAEINAEADEIPDEIPEVSWAIDIPVQNFVHPNAQQAQDVLTAFLQAQEDANQQQIEDALNQQHNSNYYDDDIESQMADYAEYQREAEMEEYLGRCCR